MRERTGRRIGPGSFPGPTGKRTRAARVAGEHRTTEPPMHHVMSWPNSVPVRSRSGENEQEGNLVTT
ncbi:unnamed protein product [Haemonchus placei]|uniref:Uncharacterized protein n=1 Tax=Haemonchus placei TaxID=6290 RepID=A0A0N4WR76_HAEPC|nr:unnamed protein product [Haemonchus placei]